MNTLKLSAKSPSPFHTIFQTPLMVGNCPYRWDGHSDVDGYCSERNEIIFSALQEIINEQAAKGFIRQGRCIKHEIIKIVRVLIYIYIFNLFSMVRIFGLVLLHPTKSLLSPVKCLAIHIQIKKFIRPCIICDLILKWHSGEVEPRL